MRLFYDIETSPCLGWFFSPGYSKDISYHQVLRQGQIICISYKFEGKRVQNIHWQRKYQGKDIFSTVHCDKALLKEWAKVVKDASVLIAHNGDQFDDKIIRARSILHDIDYPEVQKMDTCKEARRISKTGSNKLDALLKYWDLGGKIENERDLWLKVMQGDLGALKRMLRYCDNDVVQLEKLFNKIKPYMKHKVNQYADENTPLCCSGCGSERLGVHKNFTTSAGTIRVQTRCKDCGGFQMWSESKWEKFLMNV